MKMRKEEGGSGVYQTRCIRSISVVALVLALAACENTQEEPTRQAQELAEGAKATKIGEVSDLVGPSIECDKPDGQKDQGIRLQIPPELGAKVSYLQLLAAQKGSSEESGSWASCTAPVRAWRLEVT